MESLNRRVVTQVADWLQAGERCWLATVVRTYGSSPRPVGSLFAFNPLRGVVGSLSGGCVEQDLLDSLRAQDNQIAGSPRLLRYGVTEAERQRYALPCGGELQVLLEDLRPDAGHYAHWAELAHALEQRRPVSRRLDLATGQAFTVPDRLPFSLGGQQLVHCLTPGYRMLLIGAGEVALYVAQFAQALDFEITLCDPGESASTFQGLPATVEFVQAFPDDLVRARFADQQCAILALAHDPRIDDLALMEALTTPAFYVGAMGSQRTSQQRRERLESLGLARPQIDRLHAPIGLAIGSKTPAEIAVSILAHVVAERHRLQMEAQRDHGNESPVAEARAGCNLLRPVQSQIARG